MQVAADGRGREQRNRALRVGRRGGGMRTQKTSGRDRRDREITAAREYVVQTVGKLAGPIAQCIVERDRLLATQHDAA